MEKRIASLTENPHTVSLTDRDLSLFIDSNSGSIFLDEGDGEGRMNGVVFSLVNEPSFAMHSSSDADSLLRLDYRGMQYTIGVFNDRIGLQIWVESANAALNEKLTRLETKVPA